MFLGGIEKQYIEKEHRKELKSLLGANFPEPTKENIDEISPAEVDVRRCFFKIGVLKILAIKQENNCVGVSF